MEMFGAILAIPVSFVSSGLYSVFLFAFIKPHAKLSTFLFWPSLVVLTALSWEIVLTILVGPKGLEELMGPTYFRIHVGIFFLSVPSLVNAIALQRRFSIISKWYIIAPACSILTILIIMLQFYVTDILFGIDHSSH